MGLKGIDMRAPGFTLIELIIFIIILGIIGTTLLMTFQVSLKKSPVVRNVSRAVELAEKRMDFIQGQRNIIGYASFSDVCAISTTLPACTGESGYSINSSISTGWDGNSVSYKVITVNVTGNATFSLTGLVANY